MTVTMLRRPASPAVTDADCGSRQREVTVTPSPGSATPADMELVDRLRTGDSAVFTQIVRSWSPVMLHVARSFVASHASAEEAVQETWLAVIQGIDRFEGRSSVRTWVFHVLVNIARRQGVREVAWWPQISLPLRRPDRRSIQAGSCPRATGGPGDGGLVQHPNSGGRKRWR